MAAPSATDVQVIGQGGSGGITLGETTAEKVSFYGTTPIVQRSGAAQATSLLSTASSTAIGTADKAAIIEIMNTLAAIGLWKGGA